MCSLCCNAALSTALLLSCALVMLSGDDTTRRDAPQPVDLEWVHAQALEIGAFNCVKDRSYLTSRVHVHPAYAALLAAQSPRVLDFGCCMGADVRRMLSDGVASVVGWDVEPRFVELGFKVWGDRDRTSDLFVTGDVRDDSLVARVGAFDWVHCSAVLHLFHREEAKQMMVRLRSLVRPGGAFFGRVRGNRESVGPRDDGKRFLHTSRTLREDLTAAGYRVTMCREATREETLDIRNRRDIGEPVREGPRSVDKEEELKRTVAYIFFAAYA